MTAAELIAALQALPPETPVLRRTVTGNPRFEALLDLEEAWVAKVPGGWGQFQAERLLHRNNVKAVVIR